MKGRGTVSNFDSVPAIFAARLNLFAFLISSCSAVVVELKQIQRSEWLEDKKSKTVKLCEVWSFVLGESDPRRARKSPAYSLNTKLFVAARYCT